MDLVFQLCGSILLIILGLIKSKKSLAHELTTILKTDALLRKDAFYKLIDKYLLIIGFLSISMGYILTIFDIKLFNGFIEFTIIHKVLVIVGTLVIELIFALGISFIKLKSFHKYASREIRSIAGAIYYSSEDDSG